MGWAERNRIANLRDAPMNGRQNNGHDLGAGKQIVQFNPLQTAVVIVDSILPGKPMPIIVAQGQPPIMGTMIDWTAFVETLTAALPADVATWTPDNHHQRNLVLAMAQFQRAALALAEAAKGLRETQMKAAEGDKLPEAPEEGSTRRPEIDP